MATKTDPRIVPDKQIPLKVENKLTRLTDWPHLKAIGKGRLVREPDGRVVGYIQKRYTYRNPGDAGPTLPQYYWELYT